MQGQSLPELASSAAQEGGILAQPSESKASPPGSSAVTLDVVVTDKLGKEVTGLRPADFTLLDNKQPQTLISLQEASGVSAHPDVPVTVIIVVDAINEQAPTIFNERQRLESYFQGNGGHLSVPTSLIVLTSQDMRIENHPTRDSKELTDFLDRSTASIGNALPTTGRDQELARSSLVKLDSLAVALKRTPGRKLILWISHGWFWLNRFSSDPKLDDQIGNKFIATLSTELREARITLYSIDPNGVFQANTDPRKPEGYPIYFEYQHYLRPSDPPRHVDYGTLLLQVIAVQTGGQVLFSENDLGSMIDRCIADVNSYYALTFNAPTTQNTNGYHRIDIKMANPELTARTRTVYYARP